MDMTIRNLDDNAYRQLRAHARLTGRPIGELVNEAIRLYLERTPQPSRGGSLVDLPISDSPEGSERLSEEIDSIVYGT